MSDPIASADAVVAEVEPGLSPPAVRRRDAVLVTGPWLAGTTSLVAALRDRLPEHTFVEADELGPAEVPAAVVFVVSAVAPLTESDCALLDLAARHTDLVVGVVSKIDAHRNWRDVLAADRAALAGRAPRYADVSWVGVAAEPDLGEPRLDELVNLLSRQLANPDLERRNRLRAWETRLLALIDRHRADGDGLDRQARVETLRAQRDEVVRARRLARSEHTIALRSQLQQARLQLGYFARNRCTSVRAELAEDASQTGRRGLGDFQSYVRRRADDVVAEVDEGITAHLRDMADGLNLPAPPLPNPPSTPDIAAPPLKSRRLETQLMTILGAGFGLGVALMVTRLITGLAPGLTAAGLAVGGAAGLALTVWVVGIRGLLHDRAVLDRWLTDVTARVRTAAEERVATRMLTAESALGAALRSVEQEESAAARARLTAIDDELRDHTLRTARAAAARERRLPALTRALEAVRNELSAARDS